MGLYHGGSKNSYWFTDQEYFVSGFITPSFGVENRVGFIIKLDTSGNITWNKRYPQCKAISSITQISENTYLASGHAEADGYLYCQKFDSSGNIVWSRNYQNDPLAGVIGYEKIIKNFDNNFALGTPHGYNFGRLMIMDSTGNIISSKYYYYPQNFYISQNNINNTSDSGYIVAGSLDSNNISDGTKRIDALIFKIDKYGNTVSIKNNYSVSIGEDFSLSQNYPNPFNPKTVISYSITQNSNVTLKVFDLLGKEVAVLINQKQSAGSYSVDFDGANLSSGIYFYKLESEAAIGQKFVSTKRMLLLK